MSPQQGAAHEPELREYVLALAEARWWIVACGLALGLLGGLAGLLDPDEYEASARFSVIESAEAGGVNPASFRYREALTVIETGFILEGSRNQQAEVIVARLGSREFVAHFITRWDLLPLLFAEQWDPTARAWRDDPAPTLDQGVRLFRSDQLRVELDPTSGIVEVFIRHADPERAATWANQFVALFNELERKTATERSERRIAYLVNELETTRLLEIERALYRIIEAETQVVMLARADAEYVLSSIDPAMVPERPAGLSAAWFVGAGALVGFLLATSAVASRVLLAQVTTWLLSDRSS